MLFLMRCGPDVIMAAMLAFALVGIVPAIERRARGTRRARAKGSPPAGHPYGPSAPRILASQRFQKLG